MIIQPITTRKLLPPQEDVYAFFDEIDLELKEGDVLIIASKLYAIHHGRCIPKDGIDKQELIKEEADYYYDYGHRKYPLTIKHAAFISSGGVDESNGNGYYVLPPNDPFNDAQETWNYFRSKHDINNLGVIISDSYSDLFRMGAKNISIGFWGIKPLKRYKGEEDIFGREFKTVRINVIDSIAAASALVSGQGKEQSPIALVREIPDIVFVADDMRKELLVDPEKDRFYPLLKKFYTDS